MATLDRITPDQKSDTLDDERDRNLSTLMCGLLLGLVKREGKGLKYFIRDSILKPSDMIRLTEMYWYSGQEKGNTPKKRLSDRQLRDGLKLAFEKFDESDFTKLDRDGALRLRDIMFLCHPKPRNEKQARLFKKIATKQLIE